MSDNAASSFDTDRFPGHPKILFVGLPESSHTHSWIHLLDGCQFNIRLFGVSNGIPPNNWNIPTYLITETPPWNLNNELYQSLFPLPEAMAVFQNQLSEYHERIRNFQSEYEQYPLKVEDFLLNIKHFNEQWEKSILPQKPWALMKQIKRNFNRLANRLSFPQVEFNYLEWNHEKRMGEEPLPPELPAYPDEPLPPRAKYRTAEDWLAQIVQTWKPDIIHTLGAFDGQGGEYFYRARKDHHLEGIGKWILQLRGGSDLAFRHLHPDWKPLVTAMLQECDQIICDNIVNITFAIELGISPDKFSRIIPVPGTGGIDVDEIRNRFNIKPSRRERILLIPKSYESIWSKVSTTIEAIRLCWNAIKPCKIIFTSASFETVNWVYTLPKEIQENCVISDRLSREEFINQVGKARVVLAPSLVDGVPNTLYEAMACGTFPVVSPLETIRTVIQEPNVLFARNLYPEEIAKAITKAMNDDDLVDRAFFENYRLVYRLANREQIKAKVVNYYRTLVDAGPDNP